MNTIDASLRNTKTSGEVNKLRSEGNVPGIVYGGKSETQKISVSKKLLKNLIEKENFLSSILNLKIDGKDENCLLYTSPSPRDGLLSRMPSSA